MSDLQTDISPLAGKICDHLSERVHKGELSNSDMVAIINTVGSHLNLMTVSDYGKREGISYNGVLSRIEAGKVQVYELFGVRMVIYNE